MSKEGSTEAPIRHPLNFEHPDFLDTDFTICDYNNVDSDLTEKAQLPDNLGFKFFVLNWDDKDDEIKDVEDFVNYTPTNIKELLEFREQNLFYFSDIGTPLIHQYSTPGIKTIKSVLFSHTIEDFTQIVRWKFLKTRLFLDIPLNQVPDFGQLGGDEYTTYVDAHTHYYLATNRQDDFEFVRNIWAIYGPGGVIENYGGQPLLRSREEVNTNPPAQTYFQDDEEEEEDY